MAKRPVDLAIMLGAPGKGKPTKGRKDEAEDLESEDAEDYEEDDGYESDLKAHLEVLFDEPVDDERVEAFKEAVKACMGEGGTDRDSIPPEE